MDSCWQQPVLAALWCTHSTRMAPAYLVINVVAKRLPIACVQLLTVVIWRLLRAHVVNCAAGMASRAHSRQRLWQQCSVALPTDHGLLQAGVQYAAFNLSHIY